MVPVAGLPVLEEDVAELAHIGSVPRLTERACCAAEAQSENGGGKHKKKKSFPPKWTNGQNEPIIAFQQEQTGPKQESDRCTEATHELQKYNWHHQQ